MMGFGDRSWSGGLDTLAAKLRQEGCFAQVVPYRKWKSIMRTIVRDDRQKVVLIGHSHGGVQAIKGAVRILEDQGVSVRLLVLLDVGRPDPIPANIDVAVHYYVVPPTMSFRKGPRSKLEPGNTHTKLINIAVGPEGVVPAARNVDHLSISGSAAIHNMIIREMKATGLLDK
jgi:pimeloyl-ACP methyl ester carboxylesterase